MPLINSTLVITTQSELLTNPTNKIGILFMCFTEILNLYIFSSSYNL